jgi:hypothetical protein
MAHARPSGFRVDWVLRGELALGTAPRRPEHLERLEQEGIGAVLSLCADSEWPVPADLEARFRRGRVVLPEHRSGRDPSRAELEAALAELERLRAEAGPVYVHCVAGIERSPLVCMAWLMRRRGLSRLEALEYLMQVHPATSPLPGQLRALD